MGHWGLLPLAPEVVRQHDALTHSLPSAFSDVRHAFFAAFIIGSLVQILGQLLRVFAFDGEKLLKEVRLSSSSHTRPGSMFHGDSMFHAAESVTVCSIPPSLSPAPLLSHRTGGTRSWAQPPASSTLSMF